MKRKTRLAPDDWLRAGFDALAADGPQALKAEPLARALGTTKGSFYWHFDDVPAYHKELLNLWKQEALAPEGTAAGKSKAVQQLRDLAKRGFADSAETEAAMRSWARSNPEVADVVADVDAARLNQLNALLVEIGITNAEIAEIIYAARIGMDDMRAEFGGDPMGTLVDLLLALR